MSHPAATYLPPRQLLLRLAARAVIVAEGHVIVAGFRRGRVASPPSLCAGGQLRAVAL